MTVRSNIGGVIGEFSDLPGCPQIAVSHYVFARDVKTGKGRGQIAHRERLKMMKELGYDKAICTVVSSNPVEKHILDKHGWKKIDEFRSTKSANNVEIWSIDLNQYNPEFDVNSPENKTYDAWEKSLERNDG